MPFELIAHGVFSFLSGVSVAITGFGCDSSRELFAELSTGPNAYPASSAINMGLSAALVTAVQVSGAQTDLHERGCAWLMSVGLEAGVLEELSRSFAVFLSCSIICGEI